jgi:hypothetical protein
MNWYVLTHSFVLDISGADPELAMLHLLQPNEKRSSSETATLEDAVLKH